MDFEFWMSLLRRQPVIPGNPTIGVARDEPQARAMGNVFVDIPFGCTTTSQRDGDWIVVRACKPLRKPQVNAARLVLFGVLISG